MSVRNRRIVLAPEARQDLRDILLYTERRWDKQQRVAYKSKLNQAIRALGRYPYRGRERDDVSAGLRGIPIEAHVIFYRVDEWVVTIVRVLHAAIDLEDQFG